MGDEQSGDARITLKDEDTWVTLPRALQEIGVKTKGALYYYVGRADGVRTQQSSNHRDHLYNLADLKRLRAKKMARGGKKVSRMVPSANYVVQWLTPNDLAAVLDLDMRVLHHPMIGNYRLYQSWLEKNPHIALCAFERRAGADGRRTCLAYISMLPLREKIILDLLRGQKDEFDITADDIEPYDREGAYTLFVNSIVASQEHSFWAVMHEALDFWVRSSPARYVSRVYASAASESATVLIEKLRLGPIYLLKEDTAYALKDAYVLDLSLPAASRVIRTFQERMREKNLHRVQEDR